MPSVRFPLLLPAAGLALLVGCAGSTSSSGPGGPAPAGGQSASAPSPDPRVGLRAGTDRRGGGGVEPARGLGDPAAEAVRRGHQLRPGLHRQVRHSGELQRLPGVGHRESAPAQPDDVVRLSRVAERRLGLPEPALRLRRGPRRAPRLRDPGRAGHGQQGPPARAAHLRHQRHPPSQECRQRADLPRVAHPLGAGRPQGFGERLRLHLGLVRGAVPQRARRLRRGDAFGGSQHGVVPHRSHQGAGGPPGAGGDRQLAPDLRQPEGAGGARRDAGRQRGGAEGAGGGQGSGAVRRDDRGRGDDPPRRAGRHDPQGGREREGWERPGDRR